MYLSRGPDAAPDPAPARAPAPAPTVAPAPAPACAPTSAMAVQCGVGVLGTHTRNRTVVDTREPHSTRQHAVLQYLDPRRSTTRERPCANSQGVCDVVCQRTKTKCTRRYLLPMCCHDPMQLLSRFVPPAATRAPRRPEHLFCAPCTRGCCLSLLKSASRPRHDMVTTPPGVCIRTPRRMRLKHPSASRLRRKTEDPALLPLSRRPHAAVNIYPFAHTWSLPLTTRPTHSRPAYLPTARNTANVPRNMPVRTCLLRRRRTRVPHSCPRHTILSRR